MLDLAYIIGDSILLKFKKIPSPWADTIVTAFTSHSLVCSILRLLSLSLFVFCCVCLVILHGTRSGADPKITVITVIIGLMSHK